MSSQKRRKPAKTHNSKGVPYFASVHDRRRWVAATLTALRNSDPDYYRPILAAGEEGKQAYLQAFDGKCGCGKAEQPSDVEMFSVLVDVALPRGLDWKVLFHCEDCFPCFIWLSRMLTHIVMDLPGSEWSAEVAKKFPLKVKGWENPLWHFRVFHHSLENGPSFSVFSLPFNKANRPLIIGSCAGILGAGDYPCKELVAKTHAELEKRAKATNNPTPHIDPLLIVQFSRALGMDIDNEVFDFLKP